MPYNKFAVFDGVWLSLVERLVRDQEAGGSNPLTPTSRKGLTYFNVGPFLFASWSRALVAVGTSNPLTPTSRKGS